MSTEQERKQKAAVPVILVFASEVASALGKHKFRPMHETVLAVWQRFNHGRSFEAACRKFQCVPAETQDERWQQVCRALPQLAPSVAAVATQPLRSTSMANQASNHITAQLQHQRQVLEQHIAAATVGVPVARPAKVDHVTPPTPPTPTVAPTTVQEQKRLVAQLVQMEREVASVASCNLGRTREAEMVADSDEDISDNNSKYYKCVVHPHLVVCMNSSSTKGSSHSHSHSRALLEAAVQVVVGGRTDGFRAGRLLEIKHRRHGLFRTPEYDLIQLQVYMHLCDVPEAHLVEVYRPDADDRSTERRRETRVVRDDRLWSNDIVPGLCRFASLMAALVFNESRQARLLQCAADDADGANDTNDTACARLVQRWWQAIAEAHAA